MDNDSKETILNLLQLRERYQQKLRDIECSLEEACLDTEPYEDDEVELRLRIEALQDEVVTSSTHFAFKERMLKYLQFSNALRNVSVSALEQSVLEKFQLLDELGQKVMKSMVEMEELNGRLDFKRTKSLRLLIKARFLTLQLKELKESEQERENEQKSEKIVQLQRKLDRGRRVNCNLRKVLLDLIHSTQIDWYEDETLRKTVSILGEEMQTK